MFSNTSFYTSPTKDETIDLCIPYTKPSFVFKIIF